MILIRLLLILFLAMPAFVARAADVPTAAGSPLTGVSFSDQPLVLPVQRNFQMALLTVSSELGRSCGKMEAYGWRVKQSEQQRVDGIFNDTVGRLHSLGYTVEAQSPSTASHDVTIFTADKAEKHFTFMWSAGEVGLAMVLCENPRGSNVHPLGQTAKQLPSVETFTPSDLMGYSSRELPAPRSTQKRQQKFSPVGSWSGGYTCSQGYTGGTLQISSLRGQNFQGTFRFYPTPKNPSVPSGSYKVYGQYDAESGRSLINPGKWIKRPPHFYNTVMVGSFDPLERSFSAYFQGITGCTSFEARYGGPGTKDLSAKVEKKAPVKTKKHVAKKKVAKKKAAAPVNVEPMAAPAAAPAPVAAPMPSATEPTAGIDLSAPPAPASAPAAPVAAEPPLAAPSPSGAPPSPVTAPEAVPAPPTVAPNEGTAVPAAPMPPPALQPPLPNQ